MNNKNMAVFSSAMVAISGFLPFIKVSILGSSITKNLVEGGDGYFFLAIGVIALLCALNDKFIPAAISGGLSLILFVIESKDLTEQMRDNAIVKLIVKYGIGFYVLLVGSIALIVFSILAKKDKTKQGSYSERNEGDYY